MPRPGPRSTLPLARAPLAAMAAALAASLLASPTAALASKPRCRLERVDPAELADGKLRLYASMVELEGKVDHLQPSQFTLYVDRKKAGKAEAGEPFSSAGEEVDVAMVVEVATQYKPAIEEIKDSLREFLADQPRNMKVVLIPFSSELPGDASFMPAPAMSQHIDDLLSDDDSVDVRLIDAVRLGMTELNKMKPKDPKATPPRRLIVLLSDGLNVSMDRDRFVQLGKDAAAAGIPIHSIAFSPIDDRGPLLNLGELSKLSNGTFRWARSAKDLKNQLATLADEVRGQEVLTFDSPVSSTRGHTFVLKCGTVVSNAVGAKAGFGRVAVVDAGTSRWLRWVLWGLGGTVGVLVLVGGVAEVFRRRSLSRAAAPRKAAVPRARAAPAAAPQTHAPAATPAAAPAAVPTQAPVPRRAAAGGSSCQLISIGGASPGLRLPVSPSTPLTIGKAAGMGFVVEGDPTVSSRHCEVRWTGSGFVVSDLGSTNGTFVNQDRVDQRLLCDGDILRLGVSTQFKVRLD